MGTGCQQGRVECLTWSDSPAAANEWARGVWARNYGPDWREEADNMENVDGSETAPGEPYQAFACLGSGSMSMSIFVSEVQSGGRLSPSALKALFASDKKLKAPAQRRLKTIPEEAKTDGERERALSDYLSGKAHAAAPAAAAPAGALSASEVAGVPLAGQVCTKVDSVF